MSRSAVVELLGNDSVLRDEYGITSSEVFPTFTMQGSRRPPTDADGYFLVLRWEETLDVIGDVQVLTVWAHRSRSSGVNFKAIKDILMRCKMILETAVHVAGSDGDILTQASCKGMGPDVADEGYDTLAKYAVFEVNTKTGS